MPRSERLHIAMPEEFPTANKVLRVDPNNGFPVDATVNVFADEGQLLVFRAFKKGPSQKDYLLSLVGAEPPITTEGQLVDKEVNVRDDLIVEGREFILDSMFPVVIGRTTFKALEIYSNVETIIVPMDGRPTTPEADIQEAI